MKELLTIAKPYDGNMDLAEQVGILEDCGFTTASRQLKAAQYGYLWVTPEKIIDFLTKKFQLFFPDIGYLPSDLSWHYHERFPFAVGFDSSYQRDVLAWRETPIERYLNIPPNNILEAAQVAKGRCIFSKFTVATLEKFSEPIKDPLLLGHIDGCENRYIIGQWDDDILVDDLI